MRTTLALALPCAAVVLGTLAAALVFRQALARMADPLALQAKLMGHVAAWQALPPVERMTSVVLLGNSVVNCPGTSVAEALATSLAAASPPALRARAHVGEVVAITQRGLRPLHFYALLDDILAGRPRSFVIAVVLRVFSPSFTFSHVLEYAALTRNLSFRRSLAVADALHEEGLTLLDPMIYRAEDALGLLDVVTGVRVWAGDVLDGVGEGVRRLAGLRGASPVARGYRVLPGFPTVDEARADYLVDQPGSTSARVLRDIVAIARDAGRPPLLYVSPVDMDRLTELGLRDELQIDERVAALRAAIGVTPGEWLDLHAMLPARFFRDRNNHLEPEGCARVADALKRKLTGRP